MNKNLQEGTQLVAEVLNLLKTKTIKSKDELGIVFGTPFISLEACAKLLCGSEQIAVSAQNCYDKESGAYTGEISAAMIKSTGAKYIIIGHSERREYFNESSEMLAKKVDITLKHGLIPIFCCGEKLEVRNANKHFDLVKQQIVESLFHLPEAEFKKVVIAYEPVWAIGTGVTASSQQAQEMHAFIRGVLKEKYGQSVADSISILYGGSCNAANAAELFANPDVDGGLIGGASLKAEDFVKIIEAVK